MSDTEVKIGNMLSIINDAKKNSNVKRSKRNNKRMVAKKRLSFQYINQFVDTRNYRSVIDKFVCDFNKGFCTSLCVDKIKPLTDDKLEYINDMGLSINSYSITVK